MFYPEGEFIFEYGDLNGDVYFIAKGLVATYTERGDILSYVGSGSLIGEISCLFEVQRQYTAVAATDCEIYMFRKEDFLDFLSLYPNLKTTLEEACIRHYKETMDAAAKSTKSRVRMSTPTEEELDATQLIRTPMGLDRFRDFKSITTKEGPTTSTGEKSSEGTSAESSSKASEAGKETLAVVEMDFGTAKELTIKECENDPDFIYDPLRVPASSILVNERKNRDRARKHSWSAYLVSFGKVPRDEMGFLHIVQE